MQLAFVYCFVFVFVLNFLGGCLKREKSEKSEKKVRIFGVFLTKKRVRGVGSSHRGV